MVNEHFTRMVSRTGAAIVLKLLCGCDDAVWMAPFVAREGRWGKCVVAQKYVCVVAVSCSIAVGLAWFVGVAARSTTPAHERVGERIMSTFAGSLLLLFSIHLAKEEGWLDWVEDRASALGSADGLSASEKKPLVNDARGASINTPLMTAAETRAAADAEGYGTLDIEDDAGSDGDDEDLNCCEASVLLCLESGLSSDDGGPEADAARRRFIIVAALGNLDDLLVYFTIALTGMIHWYELVLGTILGAILIVGTLSTCLQMSKRATDCVTAVPCCFILGALGVWIIVSTFVPAVAPASLDKGA